MNLERRRSEEPQAVDITGLKCADLVDAMGRMHRHRCHILDLVSPTPGRILFGPAVTISYFPTCSAGLDPERYNLGAVVIPDGQVEAVLAEVRNVQAADAAFRDQIAREQIRG